MKELLILLVRIYQVVLSPLKPLLGAPVNCCRFSPSCSVYAIDALRQHGAQGGTMLAVKRVMRCHPWGEAGYDPVPDGRKATGSHG